MPTRYSGAVIVLGHSGFIGRALTRDLRERGADVHGFASRDLDLRNPAAFDVLDPLLEAESVVFVCAALTPDRGASIDTSLDHIGLTGNLARRLSQRTLRKCIFLSSDAVYPMIDAPVDELTPIGPVGAYPVAKYTSECLMQMAFAQHPEQLLIVRPTAIFGPGDTHNSYGPNRFVRAAVADHTLRLFGHGEETRDHLYIDDLTRILVDLGTTDACGILNVATGTSRSFDSIVEDLRGLTPEPFDVQYAPRSGAITHRQFATGRLAELFPDLQFTPFEDGLRAMVEAAVSTPTPA
jgi:UDP-glucose 4-epimerase